MGYVILGIAALTQVGFQGALLVMIAHGLYSGLLFSMVGLVYERTHTREVGLMSGLAKRMPFTATVFMFAGLASLVFLPGAGKPPYLKDEAVLLDPTGHVVWTYEISHLVPGGQGLYVQGDGKVPLIESPYGRLAGVICFDLDYPGMVRQAGQGGADLLFGPSDDWQAFDPLHAQHATFRAIENGFSLVREASRGLSMTVDYEGRVLASSDYFTTDQQVMVAYVPMHGVRTIYATIGDLFAWLCMMTIFVRPSCSLGVTVISRLSLLPPICVPRSNVVPRLLWLTTALVPSLS